MLVFTLLYAGTLALLTLIAKVLENIAKSNDRFEIGSINKKEYKEQQNKRR